VLVNEEGNFTDQTQALAPALETPGMVTDALWHDLDGSGTEELVVVGEWMPIRVFAAEGDGLSERTSDYFEQSHHGFWYSVEVVPMDGNRLGLLAGNLGRNTQIRATQDEPAELFYDDYDGDGDVDPIFSYYINGERYPHVLLDRLRETVPSLAARFGSYSEYADASLGDLLSTQEREQADRLWVDGLETSLFVLGEGPRFNQKPLPVDAQFSPVHSIEVLDYDEDGISDLLLAGNANETRVRFPKYDANYGLLLHGEGQGRFSAVPQQTSGFKVRGDVRSLTSLGSRLLFGVNRDSLKAYQPVNSDPSIDTSLQAREQ
jgi:hypothetical protein